MPTARCRAAYRRARAAARPRDFFVRNPDLSEDPILAEQVHDHRHQDHGGGHGQLIGKPQAGEQPDDRGIEPQAQGLRGRETRQHAFVSRFRLGKSRRFAPSRTRKS